MKLSEMVKPEVVKMHEHNQAIQEEITRLQLIQAAEEQIIGILRDLVKFLTDMTTSSTELDSIADTAISNIDEIINNIRTKMKNSESERLAIPELEQLGIKKGSITTESIATAITIIEENSAVLATTQEAYVTAIVCYSTAEFRER